eukprot:UN28007
MYVDVANVRTKDDAVIDVQMFIFFEINSIEQMMDSSHDPVSDMNNALASDVIDFTATRHFETFKDSTEVLNNVSTFPTLQSRMNTIGINLNKVVFRGYKAPKHLQTMQDDAISQRTQLQLETETEEQRQKLENYKLQMKKSTST